SEITQTDRVLGGVEVGRLIPLPEYRQRFACKRGISRRLMPAHARDRIIAPSFRIMPTRPCGRPWTSGGVAEQLHRLFPAHRLTVVVKHRGPVFWILVSALINKLLIFAVGHLVPVDVIRREGVRTYPANEGCVSGP